MNIMENKTFSIKKKYQNTEKYFIFRNFKTEKRCAFYQELI